MIDRAGFRITSQVLLADVRNVTAFIVLGQKVVERLIARGAYVCGDRFIPFFAIGEDRVDVENDTPKIEQFMPYDISYSEPRL